jgi:transglutaminase-like putative cysteine protease
MMDMHANLQHETAAPAKTMQLFVQASLAYWFPRPAEVLLLLEAARSPSQVVHSEQLLITPGSPVARLDDPHTGERRAVFTASGDVEIHYSATVEVIARDADLSGARASPVRELPPEALNYLFPSRYCPSDRLEGFVEQQFRGRSGGDKVLAMLDWLAASVEYRPGVSDVRWNAVDTFTARAGVCRDFSHLAIAFCRAANIPARAVSAYAWKLDPPDMHALTEVYLDGRWRLIDPTGRAPMNGIIRVATGRDAGDIAFMTIFGDARLIAQTFSVTELATLPQAVPQAS